MLYDCAIVDFQPQCVSLHAHVCTNLFRIIELMLLVADKSLKIFSEGACSCNSRQNLGFAVISSNITLYALWSISRKRKRLKTKTYRMP